MIQVDTNEFRYALTVNYYGDRHTTMYRRHDVMMSAVRYALNAGSIIESVETLESAIRADAMARGQW